MIYHHAELLLSRMDEQIARDGAAEMRMNFLAFATDNVAQYSTGQSRGLLKNENQAVQWCQSIRTLAEWTLIGRHLSWAIPLVLQMPMWPLKQVLPEFARIVALHHVSILYLNYIFHY